MCLFFDSELILFKSLSNKPRKGLSYSNFGTLYMDISRIFSAEISTKEASNMFCCELSFKSFLGFPEYFLFIKIQDPPRSI